MKVVARRGGAIGERVGREGFVEMPLCMSRRASNQLGVAIGCWTGNRRRHEHHCKGDAPAAHVPACSMQAGRAGIAGLMIFVAAVSIQRRLRSRNR
jgi:hypothetical protein